MGQVKTRMIASTNPLYPANNKPAKLGKHTLTDTHQLQRYVTKNRGNPFAYLCRVIAGTPITCSHYDEETGEYRDVKVRASIPQRNEAARILAAKMLPDLKALDVTATQQVSVDIARVNTAQLYAYLAQVGIQIPDDGVVEDSNIESTEYALLPPAQSQTTQPSAPMPSIPIAEAALLVPTSDLPAGQDKSAHLDALAAQSQAWQPAPPDDLTSD